ncbi:MAG: hypothetical protein KatS3mg062_0207 [Tepidiforma sp.]|nr:MAG: hypothetical protein KatS3mg062_0207 [Tepidiforma sp.]
MRQEERRARTRRLLLEAARGVVSERGYEGASLDAIAAAARLSKGAVYAHFATKLDLYLAVTEEVLADARLRVQAVAGAVEAGARPEDAAAAYFHPAESPVHAAVLMDIWTTAGRETTVRQAFDSFLREREELISAAAVAAGRTPTQALALAGVTCRLIDAEVLYLRHGRSVAGERSWR